MCCLLALHFLIFLSACDEQLLPNPYCPGIHSLQLEFRPFIDDLQSLREQLIIHREVKDLFSSFCVSFFDVDPLMVNPTVVSRSFRFPVANRRRGSLPMSARPSTLPMTKLLLVRRSIRPSSVVVYYTTSKLAHDTLCNQKQRPCQESP